MGVAEPHFEWYCGGLEAGTRITAKDDINEEGRSIFLTKNKITLTPVNKWQDFDEELKSLKVATLPAYKFNGRQWQKAYLIR